MVETNESITLTLSRRELSLCVKGVGALGMIWNKAGRAATETERAALIVRLTHALSIIKQENLK